MAFFYFILIVILCLINVLSIYNISSAFEILRQPIQIVLICCTIMNCIIPSKNLSKIHFQPVIISFILFIYLLLQLLFNSTNYLNDFSNSLFGIIVFILFYTTNWKRQSINNIIRISPPILFLFSTLYIYRRIDPSFSSPEAWSLYINSIYYPICLLPFAILNKKYCYISILFVLICTLLSAKQGAFIIITISSILYYILNQRLEGKKLGLSFFIIVCVSISVGIYLYEYVVNTYDTDIIEGFSTLSEDGGSGRSDIYMVVISLLYSADCFQLLLGHGGLNSVANDIGISAHNDFLEVLYDFGIIGFSIYLLFIRLIIGKTIDAYRIRSGLTIGLFISVAAFIVLSLVSHIMFILKYGLLILSFWGMSLNLLSSKEYGK